MVRVGNPVQISRNLWSHRYLIQQMVRRDLTQRYRGSYLGLFWTVINPILMLTIYTFVFSVVFNARWRPGAETPRGEFALTMYAGLIAFNLFSEVINRAPTIVAQNPNYVKKVVFPLEVLVVVITITSLVTSMINLGILLVGSLIILRSIPPTIVFLPLVYLSLVMLTAGLAWFLASLGVYIRDIGQVIGVIVTVLFFITPIFYSAEAVPPAFQFVMRLNPLAMIVENFRRLLIWGEMITWGSWAIWTGIFFMLVLGGYTWFIATKKGFADVL
jgi:lipopolysaccharide transport system permease protein